MIGRGKRVLQVRIYWGNANRRLPLGYQRREKKNHSNKGKSLGYWVVKGSPKEHVRENVW